MVTNSYDLSGLDYEDTIHIQLSFSGRYNEKDILLKIKLSQIDNYILFSDATRVVMMHDLEKWQWRDGVYGAVILQEVHSLFFGFR